MTVKSLTRSSLVNNRWYENMLAGNAAYIPATYELLETQILTGAQSSIVFSSLDSKYAADYQHLQIRGVVQSTRASSLDSLRIKLNGDTASNYSFHFLQGGNPSSVTSSSGANSNNIFAGYIPGTSNSFSWSPTITDILDAFETTKNKTTRSLTGQIDPNWQLTTFCSGSWRNTNALTSIEISPEIGPNFSIGTRISLYGMRAN
jgi:hypothetical protein